MGKAILTFTSEGDELNITVEFDPPVNKEGSDHLSHSAAMIAFDAVATELGANPEDVRAST